VSWLLNLGMLGKGTPSGYDTFTALSCNGTPGRPHRFVAKTASTVQGVSAWHYYRFVAQMGA